MPYTQDKLTTIEVAALIECEGIGYAIQDHTSADYIEDPELADMWARAKELLDAIDAYCREAVELAEENDEL